MGIKEKIANLLATLSEIQKSTATDKLAFELRERENVFTMLTFSMLTGTPTPCSFLTLELLPLMERQLIMLCNSAYDSNDMLATLASHLDGF